MLLLLLNYVVLRALWKIDVNLISTLVNKSLYYIIIIIIIIIIQYTPLLCFHIRHIRYTIF